jgi:hypothetical protein
MPELSNFMPLRRHHQHSRTHARNGDNVLFDLRPKAEVALEERTTRPSNDSGPVLLWAREDEIKPTPEYMPVRRTLRCSARRVHGKHKYRERLLERVKVVLTRVERVSRGRVVCEVVKVVSGAGLEASGRWRTDDVGDEACGESAIARTRTAATYRGRRDAARGACRDPQTSRRPGE